MACCRLLRNRKSVTFEFSWQLCVRPTKKSNEYLPSLSTEGTTPCCVCHFMSAIRPLECLEAGVSQHDVAEHFHCHRNTILALVRRYHERNDAADRPRITTQRQDHWIQVTHLRNRRETAADTAQRIPNNRRIHPTTVCRRLREIGLRPCRPAVRINMTEHHHQARCGWCRRHVRHPLRWWRNVMFTDESRFQLSRSDGRIRVYRRRVERYAQCCIVERDRYGGGSVMIWGGITAQHRTNVIIV